VGWEEMEGKIMKINKEDYACYYSDGNIKGNIKGYFINDEQLDEFNNGNEHTEESREAFCKAIGAKELVYVINSAAGKMGEYEIIFEEKETNIIKVGIQNRRVLSDSEKEIIADWLDNENYVIPDSVEAITKEEWAGDYAYFWECSIEEAIDDLENERNYDCVGLPSGGIIATEGDHLFFVSDMEE
jgi:hypothetical protein